MCMNIFSEIEKLSKRYWSHEYTPEYVDDRAFDTLSENFIKISKKLRDNEQELTKAALKDLWSATLLLQQTVGRNIVELTQAATQITERVERLLSMYKDQFGESFLLMDEQLNNIKLLCNNRNIGILKGTTIGRVISANKNAFIVCKRPEMIDGLKSLVNQYNKEISIYTLYDLPESSDMDIAVLPCWPGHKAMEKLVRACLADKYIVIGYNYEIAWAESYFKKLHYFPSENILSIEDKKSLFPELSISWPERPKILISQKSEDMTTMVEGLTKTKKYKDNLTSSRPEENVEATYCDLSGDYFAYLTDRYSPNLLQIKGESISIKEITMKDLDEGQLLVFRGESEEGAVRSIVDSTHKDSKQLRAIVKTWEREIKTKFHSATDLHRAIEGSGYKISYQAILVWYSGLLRIAPEDKNLDMIAKILGVNSETSKRLPEIKNASKILIERHIEAGQVISNALRSKISEVREKLSQSGGSVKIPNLGQIQVVQLESIDKQKKIISRNNTNKILKQT